MLDALIALMQTAAVGFLLWGAYLCLFCRDRRRGERTSVADRRSNVIDLVGAMQDRATDFEIGFRRGHAEKLAA